MLVYYEYAIRLFRIEHIPNQWRFFNFSEI